MTTRNSKSDHTNQRSQELVFRSEGLLMDSRKLRSDSTQLVERSRDARSAVQNISTAINASTTDVEATRRIYLPPKKSPARVRAEAVRNEARNVRQKAALLREVGRIRVGELQRQLRNPLSKPPHG
jgi:hypothetical protein